MEINNTKTTQLFLMYYFVAVHIKFIIMGDYNNCVKYCMKYCSDVEMYQDDCATLTSYVFKINRTHHFLNTKKSFSEVFQTYILLTHITLI